HPLIGHVTKMPLGRFLSILKPYKRHIVFEKTTRRCKKPVNEPRNNQPAFDGGLQEVPLSLNRGVFMNRLKSTLSLAVIAAVMAGAGAYAQDAPPPAEK